ncbi:unnamed protein product, partial [Ceratitis capitata]
GKSVSLSWRENVEGWVDKAPNSPPNLEQLQCTFSVRRKPFTRQTRLNNVEAYDKRGLLLENNNKDDFPND